MENQGFWNGTSGEMVCEATFNSGDSHDGLRSKLHQAIDGKVQSGADMSGAGDQSKERDNAGYSLHHVQDVHDKHVIYSMGGKSFAHKYEKDGEGDPQLKGNPQEVQHAFTSVAKNKESFTESTPFEPEAGKKVELLCEAFGDKGEISFTVIKPGWSKNNRYYSESLLKKSTNIFEGAKMFMNHATEAQDKQRPEGDLRDWVGNITKVWGESDGTIKATAKVIDPAFKAKLALLGESNMLNTMGVSIRASGEVNMGEAEGKKGKIVEKFTGAKSVDFVTFAGAGGQVESLL